MGDEIVKILHLDFDDLGNALGGGQAKRTFEINRRLSRHHNVTVVTSRYPGSRDEIRDGVPYVRIGTEGFPWNLLTWFASLPLAIRRHEADLIVEDFTVPISTGLLPLFTRTPVVGVANLHAGPLSRKYKFPFVLAERIGCRFYRYFIAATNALREQVLRYNRNACVQIIPCGVDRELFAVDPHEEDFILFLGRIDAYTKGLDLLVRAFDRIAGDTHDALVIAGAGRDLPRVEAMLQRTGLSHRVRLVGRIPEPEKIRLLSRCKFLCVPSRYETFGIVAAEALACQKPVVAFDIPALREVAVDGCALRVPAFDTDALAKAMATLLKEQGLRHEMGLRGRDWARQYDWGEIARRQEAFYYQAIG